MKLWSTALPYLLLVSFYSGTITGLDTKKIELINGTSYAGIAVPIADPYVSGDLDISKINNSIDIIKSNCQKHIWPWIFFNRFIGFEKRVNAHSEKADNRVFQNIKGMDLYNQSGCLQDFYSIWRLGLRMAKETGSPGIVVDPEPYNNYDVNQLEYLSGKLGINEDITISRLKTIGKDLMDITQEEYPNATLWFLYTGVGSTIGPPRYKKVETSTITYIIEGLLDRAKEIKSNMILVSGGEMSLGYCHKSYESLLQTIKERQEQFKPYLNMYPNLHLGGTVAPWKDEKDKTSWMTRGQCEESGLKNMDDFKPIIDLLKSSYEYVWIYAASAAGFDPFITEPRPE